MTTISKTSRDPEVQLRGAVPLSQLEMEREL